MTSQAIPRATLPLGILYITSLDRVSKMYAYLVRFLSIALLLVATSTHAANFGVSPLSVDLNAQQRSSVVTVSNDDTKPVSLRVRLMRWTQASDGSDAYEPSEDLVYFPKRLELKPGEQKIIRTGMNNAALSGERAYRLFIEELPPVELPTDGQTKLSVLLTFALPVFVAPTAGKSDLGVQTAELGADGKLTLTLNNKGSARARISRVLNADSSPLADNLSARYIFANSARTIVAQLGNDACSRAISTVKLDLDNSSIDVPVSRAGCKR
jgi:fimbrial chaperone protein